MKPPQKYHQKKESGDSGVQRRAVGYVRVSTDMQATEGLSLEAQQSAIEGYCAIHGIKLVRICKDVCSSSIDSADRSSTSASCTSAISKTERRSLSQSAKPFGWIRRWGVHS